MKELTKEQMEIVKREHPEWFNDIEVGKWYRGVGNKLICITNLPISSHASAYGFSAYGIWYNDDGSYSWRVDDLKQATPEEVKSALIAESKRRYKIGDILTKIHEDYARGIRSFGGNEFFFEDNKLYVRGVDGRGYDYAIFKDGQWASVLTPEKPSLQDDIQALKDRWPDINFTIISEGEEMSKLIISHAEVKAKKHGGETKIGTGKPNDEFIDFDIPKSIDVSINVELTTSGDFEKYWNNMDLLKKEVFSKLFGKFINDNKFEIEL